MEILVLGAGCPKCKKTEENARKALEITGLDARLEHIYDLKKIGQYGVKLTPALVINGQIMISGRVPSVDEIVELLKSTN